MFKEQDQAAKLVELAELRAKIAHAEMTAQTNKAAAELMSQMISAGHIKQDSGNTIVLNAKNGEHRFGINPSVEYKDMNENHIQNE